jgi:hypothetical protein
LPRALPASRAADGDRRDIAHALDPLDRVELTAVIVALASMVDPDALLADLLGHVTWDEHGQPAAVPDLGRATLRGLVPTGTCTPSGTQALFEYDRRLKARAVQRSHNWNAAEVARYMGISHGTAVGWLAEGAVSA